jgi:flap endonuclease-1
MGIKNLNKFLKENAKESIKLGHVSELNGKKIAIDISIYMYKFASEGTLIENMYLMLSIFRYYNVIPIFVFDGKPPAEKKELLQKRREDKKEAEAEFNELKNKLQINANMEESEKQEIINNMDMLKRKFVNVSKSDIENVKDLIRAYGATYYDAPGEADELCAMLTIKGKVWACLSEDMDMFVYGCPRVIRYLSLLNHTYVMYYMKEILLDLGITQKELREICILSGTDYNCVNGDDSKNHTLYTTLKHFKKYHHNNKNINNNNNNNNNNSFYNWLLNTTNYINDYEMLIKIYDMFDLSKNHYDIKIFEDIRIANSVINKETIHKILKTDGFMFPESNLEVKL